MIEEAKKSVIAYLHKHSGFVDWPVGYQSELLPESTREQVRYDPKRQLAVFFADDDIALQQHRANAERWLMWEWCVKGSDLAIEDGFFVLTGLRARDVDYIVRRCVKPHWQDDEYMFSCMDHRNLAMNLLSRLRANEGRLEQVVSFRGMQEWGLAQAKYTYRERQEDPLPNAPGTRREWLRLFSRVLNDERGEPVRLEVIRSLRVLRRRNTAQLVRTPTGWQMRASEGEEAQYEKMTSGLTSVVDGRRVVNAKGMILKRALSSMDGEVEGFDAKGIEEAAGAARRDTLDGREDRIRPLGIGESDGSLEQFAARFERAFKTRDVVDRVRNADVEYE